jgi:hypothetical protein
MWPVHSVTGESGWQMCSLCEINGRKIKTKEDFALAAKAAAIIGTLQAGYTDFAYLGQTTKEIVEREALLGVSITGMMDNPDVIFDPEVQKAMAQLVLAVNERVRQEDRDSPGGTGDVREARRNDELHSRQCEWYSPSPRQAVLPTGSGQQHGSPAPIFQETKPTRHRKVGVECEQDRRGHHFLH